MKTHAQKYGATAAIETDDLNPEYIDPRMYSTVDLNLSGLDPVSRGGDVYTLLIPTVHIDPSAIRIDVAQELHMAGFDECGIETAIVSATDAAIRELRRQMLINIIASRITSK